MPALDHVLRLAMLRILSDGHFHSGEYLGQQLSVSRAAISKQMKILQQWGVCVDSVSGRGYRVQSPFQLFCPNLLSKRLPDVEIIYLPVIDSTNQYLLDHTQALSSGVLCLAEHQSQGRGRRGRSWQSPFGTSIAMSIYWQLKGGVSAAMGLSLVVGLAIVNALETLGVPDLQLKWPNDIYCQGKKLGGILVEMRGQVGEAAHVIIGVGLNLNLPSEQVIEQSWINLSEICEGLPDKNILVSALYQAIICQIHIYETEGFSKFQAQWQRWDIFYDQRVVLLFDDRQVIGIAKGVNEQGGLLLDVDGALMSYYGGEITVRPFID